MKRSPLTYRTALLLSLGLALVMHLLFFIMFVFGREAVMPSDAPVRPQHRFDIYRLATSFLINFVYLFIIYIANFRILRTQGIKPRGRIALIVLCTLALVAVMSPLGSQLQILLFDMGRHPERFMRGSLTRDFFIAVIAVFCAEVIYLNYRRQQIALENETLTAENVRTRYEALKNQVDPHFLFNSLNTLNSIIKTDPDTAQDYVQQLSYVFRHTLQNKEVVTLQEELGFTGAYCKLMKTRYGESLVFDLDIDERYNQYTILSLTIQTLVENAIKHNVASNRKPLVVTIKTLDDNSIIVSNPIQHKKDPEPGEGIGLANLAERYRLKWQRTIEVMMDEGCFRVKIPLLEP